MHNLTSFGVELKKQKFEVTITTTIPTPEYDLYLNKRTNIMETPQSFHGPRHEKITGKMAIEMRDVLDSLDTMDSYQTLKAKYWPIINELTCGNDTERTFIKIILYVKNVAEIYRGLG